MPKKTLRLTLTQVLVANICTADLVGIEEAAVFAESANQFSGKSHIAIRCRDDGVLRTFRKDKCIARNIRRFRDRTSRLSALVRNVDRRRYDKR